jgi:hypothetical protein
MDYLILGFDERGALTTLVWPEVADGKTRLTFAMPGYRDRLCSLLVETLRDATMESDETIKFIFEGGTEMRIPLRSYVGTGERAILTGPKHSLLVF